MKFRINKWLGCSLAVAALFGTAALAPRASARQVTGRYNYRVAQPRYQSNASLEQVTSIPDQGYTNYVTGTNALYTLPGTVPGSRRILTKGAVRNLAARRVRFMAYRRAITNRGSVYYKIVSQRHSVRGWMYSTAIRSVLTPKQQKTDLTLASQIKRAEILADQNKHSSLLDHSNVNLGSARRELRHAKRSVRNLRGTADYSGAKASYSQGLGYLTRIKSATPNLEAVQGINAIKNDYDKAAKSVVAARSASSEHRRSAVDKDIKAANRSLRHVRRVLHQIHDPHDRRAAMALFDQALSYVNDNYSFVPASDLDGRGINARRLPVSKEIALVRGYENDAQNSIMDLYPNLDNFDVTLMDAYRAQDDLNRAQDIVTSLRGSHLKKTELNELQSRQHAINELWNV